MHAPVSVSKITRHVLSCFFPRSSRKITHTAERPRKQIPVIADVKWE